MERNRIRLTVGAIVEHDGKVLVVHEYAEHDAREAITQPSGHVEHNEPYLEALVREVKEETGYTVEPTHVIGVYHQIFSDDSSAVRLSFTCKLVSEEQDEIDKNSPEIKNVLWLTKDEIMARADEFRTGATESTFRDYFAGKSYPLEVINLNDHR